MKNNQKFSHQKLQLVINVVYITSFMYLFGFTVYTILNEYQVI